MKAITIIYQKYLLPTLEIYKVQHPLSVLKEMQKDRKIASRLLLGLLPPKQLSIHTPREYALGDFFGKIPLSYLSIYYYNKVKYF